jgi:hypothetical protein
MEKKKKYGSFSRINGTNNYLASFQYRNTIMSGKHLFLFWVIFYCNAQAQPKYIIRPSCGDTTINMPLVVYFTSDGGWRSYDKRLADSLCADNISLMAVNSYKFFRKRKTPQQTLDSILPYIDKNLKKDDQKIILAGYSFGAEVVPFLYNLMSDEWKNKVAFIVLLSPSDNSDFKIHLFDMVGINYRRWSYDVLSEIMKIDSTKIIVFWGKDEKRFLKEKFTKHNNAVYSLNGGHRRTLVTPVIAKINELVKDQTVEIISP